MRSSTIGILALLLAARPTEQAGQYQTAQPGYHYEFPRDHFNHPEFQTEWWYYTGNLKTAAGRRFGFELTFFRQAVDRKETSSGSKWKVSDLYLAHLALSDLDGGQFHHAERTNRPGPGIAGVSETDGKIWNGNWSVHWSGKEQELQAVEDRFTVRLRLRPEKPPVVHGVNGVSKKAAGAGRASHYVSLTRIAATGKISLSGKDFDVTGTAWMDHEFFTHQLERNQSGWDWLSVQLSDGTELMLFHIRQRDGSIDPYSAGTYVDASGKSSHLSQSEFTLMPAGETWQSASTGARYPIAWKIEIAKLGLRLDIDTALRAQEVDGKTTIAPSYWEGAMRISGQRGNGSVEGVGYLEMTGYDRPVTLGN